MSEQGQTGTKKAKLALRTVQQVVSVTDGYSPPASIDFESTGDTESDLEKAREIAAANGWTDFVDWDAGIEDERDHHANGAEV